MSLAVLPSFVPPRLVSAELLRLVRKIEMDFVENFSSDSISVALISINESFRYLDKPASDIDLGKNAKLIGIFRDGELRYPSDLAHLYNGDKILVASKLEKLPPDHATTLKDSREKGHHYWRW